MTQELSDLSGDFPTFSLIVISGRSELNTDPLLQSKIQHSSPGVDLTLTSGPNTLEMKSTQIRINGCKERKKLKIN